MNYQCPNCRGGFEEPESNSNNHDCCPWCRQVMGEFEPVDPMAQMQEYMNSVQEQMDLGGTDTDDYRFDP